MFLHNKTPQQGKMEVEGHTPGLIYFDAKVIHVIFTYSLWARTKPNIPARGLENILKHMAVW
eukprot:bmy_20795T0